jgi:hypothetical protein
VPVIVTRLPPALGPDVGLTPVTTGGFVGIDPYVTLKLEVAGVVCESVNPEVVACVMPLAVTLFIWAHPPKASTGPVSPSRVADASVKVTGEKFANGSTLEPREGASTIHSADDR